MLPIAPHIKICLESMFLVILLGYVVYNLKHPHLTSAACAALSVPLLIDLLVFHAVRPPAVTVALNVPFLLVVASFTYVKILRKSWIRLRQKLVLVLMLLSGD